MPLDPDRLCTFPLWPPTKEGKCACGKADCVSKPGTHPIARWRDLEAGESIEGPDNCNWGIATGMRSGVFVVDLDGDDAFRWWVGHGGEFDTYQVATSRGVHLYFEQPSDVVIRTSAGVIAPQVDIRGEGGMVVAEGSLHRSGHVYTVVDEEAEVLPAPAWLLKVPGVVASLDEARAAAEPGANAPTPVDLSTPQGQERLRLGVVACATMEPSIEGMDGSGKLWDLALKLVRELELPLDTAAGLVESTFNPRCSPPWPRDLVLHKLEDARDRSDKPTGVGWSDDDLVRVCGKLRAASRSLRPGYVPTRRTHNPEHMYTFTPGKDTSGMSEEPSAKLLVDVSNMLATHPDWDGSLQWDVFRDQLVAVDPPLRLDAEKSGLSDSDITGIRMWLECHGTLLQKGEAFDVIRTAAKQVKYHPIKEYLESCRGRGRVEILDDLSAWLFGAAEPLAQQMLKKTLVAAVRRIYHPGTQVDTMLVLTGPQGARKSTFVRMLFGKEFTRSQMPDLESKDASVALAGFWGIELAELDKILRAGNETVLEFLSRTVDDFRAPYARMESHNPRQCVFVGTTNADDFLRDANGHRRYWPIKVVKVDLAYLSEHRDAIWGAALALAEDPSYEHWFSNEDDVKEAHESFITTDAWHEVVRSYLEGKKTVTTDSVFVHALGGEIRDFDKAKQMRLADTLKRLGCTSRRSNGRRNYYPPAELASVEKPETPLDRLKARRG